MELSLNTIISALAGLGVVYLVVYNFFQKKKYANYREYLAGKKTKLERTAYTKLVNQEIAELKTEMKVREAKGQKVDPRHNELLVVVEAEKDKLDSNLE